MSELYPCGDSYPGRAQAGGICWYAIDFTPREFLPRRADTGGVGGLRPPAVLSAHRSRRPSSVASVIADLLAPPVAAVEVFGDLDAPLFPEEHEVIARAVPRRRREFAAVRACARAALAQIGVSPAPILPDEWGAPGWPAGVVGSMSHCAGHQACAVAHSSLFRTIGIDAEPNEPLPDGVLTTVALPGEQLRVQALLRASPAIRWDRLLFSAKESVYKAWFPVARRWLDFEDVDVTISDVGRFSASVLRPGPIREFHGRWATQRGLVATAIAVPSGPWLA